MKKIRKEVLIDEFIEKDIEYKKKINGFNISDWFRSKYYEDFLPQNHKEKLIQYHEEQISTLKDQLKELKPTDPMLGEVYTREEKRFLCEVSRKLREGFDEKRILTLFNNTHNRDINLTRFRWLVKFYNNHDK